MTTFYRFLPLLAGLMLAVGMSSASAQWGWKEGGRTIYSDQPPPSSVAAKDIIRRPAGAKAPSEASPNPGASPAAAVGKDAGATAADASAATASAPARSASAASAAKSPAKETELDKKKKELDAKKQAEKKEQDQKQAAVASDNCARARQAKSNFESGQRIATTNAKGEREFMDEGTRQTEIKRLDGIIAADCK